MACGEQLLHFFSGIPQQQVETDFGIQVGEAKNFSSNIPLA